jgi:Tol biopolymer transport system component
VKTRAAILIGITVALVACSHESSSPTGPGNNTPTTPAARVFPYDDLGAGRFVFNAAGITYLVDSRARNATETALPALGTASPDGQAFLFEYATTEGSFAQAGIGTRDWSGRFTEIYKADPIFEHPSWSRDGSKVFFIRWGSGAPRREIVRVAVGSRQLQVTDPQLDQGCPDIPGPVSESKDGTIAFLARIPSATTGCAGTGIFTIQQDGSEKRFVFQDSASSVLYTPVWSPDGKLIAFGVHTSLDAISNAYQTVIRVVNAAGSGTRIIAAVSTIEAPGKSADISQVCWSSDGTHILFAVFDSVDGYNIYSATTDGSRVTKVAPGGTVSCLS